MKRVEHDVLHRTTATDAVKECKEQTARKPLQDGIGSSAAVGSWCCIGGELPVELRPQPDYRQGHRPQRLLGGRKVAKKKAKRKVAKKAAKKKVAKRKKKKAKRRVC